MLKTKFFIGIIAIVIFVYAIFVNIPVIKKTWNDYKYSPIFQLYYGDKNKSISQKVEDFIKNIFTKFFKTAVKPFENILTIILSILYQFNDNIQSIRKIIKYIRDKLKNIASDLYSRLKKTYLHIKSLINKIHKIIVGLFKTFESLLNFLLYTYYSIKSTLSFLDPLFGMAKFFCFDENTVIDIYDSRDTNIIPKPVKIKNIQVGDKLKNGIVEGVLKFDCSQTQMYDYNGIIVSGSHTVYDQNIKKWIEIYESSDAIPISKYSKQYIYCLITSNSKINIIDKNNKYQMFADYYETTNITIRKNIQNIILKHHNNSNPNRKLDQKYEYLYFTESLHNLQKYSVDWWAYNGNVLIDLFNKSSVKIKDLKIGDLLKNNNKVTGIIKLNKFDTQLYIYTDCLACREYIDSCQYCNIDCNIDCNIGYNNINSRHKNPIYLTNSNIVEEGGKWIYVKDSKYAQKVKSVESADNIADNVVNNYLYAITTEHGEIYINDIKFKDFTQYQSKKLHMLVEHYVKHYLNYKSYLKII